MALWHFIIEIYTRLLLKCSRFKMICPPLLWRKFSAIMKTPRELDLEILSWDQMLTQWIRVRGLYETMDLLYGTRCCLIRWNSAQAWRNSNSLLSRGFLKIVPANFAGPMSKDWDMLIFLSNRDRITWTLRTMDFWRWINHGSA